MNEIKILMIKNISFSMNNFFVIFIFKKYFLMICILYFENPISIKWPIYASFSLDFLWQGDYIMKIIKDRW